MVRILDARTSQGSNGQGPGLTEFTLGVPQIIAQVGLEVDHPGPSIRTLFSGIVNVIGYRMFSNGWISILVYRGTDSSGELIYQAGKIVRGGRWVSPATLRFSGADYDVPPPENGQLIYTVYAIFSSTSTTPFPSIRPGPESFNATVYCDD